MIHLDFDVLYCDHLFTFNMYLLFMKFIIQGINCGIVNFWVSDVLEFDGCIG